MGAFRRVLPFSLLSLSLAQSYPTSLQWGPCNKTEVPSNVPVECSTLLVPLDYSEPKSNETLLLDLVRVPAPVKPSKGSILFNFGGPGGTARDVIGINPIVQELLALTGRQFDLIAFDPRGTSGSRIPMRCIQSETDAWNYALNTGPSNSSDVALANLWARGAITADICYRNQKKIGSLISSAFVARDMIRIVDALGEDGLLRYYGFSYGTTLGATVAAMFPDRIERMILDGVQNPHEYYHSQADIEEWTDSDKEFSAIFTSCVENREKCALAQGNNKTAAQLEQDVWNLLDTLKFHPVSIRNFLIDYSTVKGLLTQSLYDSAGWPALTLILNYVLTGQLEEIGKVLDASSVANITDIFALIARPLALTGIHCSDTMVRTEKFEDFVPVVEQMYSKSRIFGDSLVFLYATCAQWKIEPKERYTGDFNVKTKHPVLFIGNTNDGLTPLVSAKNVSSTFEGSVVLTVDGYGHSSLVAPSACTIRTTSAYWVNGTLPPDGEFCESDAPLYSGITWTDVINKYYGNGTAPVRRDISPIHKLAGPLLPPFII